MWPFSKPKIAPDDLRRVDRLEEQVESLTRRMHSLIEDLEEFYAKVNKARQRVVKEDRDAARNGQPQLPFGGTREEQKAALRAQLRAGGAR